MARQDDGGALVVGVDTQVVPKVSRRSFSVEYKLGVLAEYDAADALGRGALLRREGLYTSSISLWRRARDRGGAEALGGPRGPKPDPGSRRVAELEAVNARLGRELATARSVIKVQGELAALLEQLSTSSATPRSQSGAGK